MKHVLVKPASSKKLHVHFSLLRSICFRPAYVMCDSYLVVLECLLADLATGLYTPDM